MLQIFDKTKTYKTPTGKIMTAYDMEKSGQYDILFSTDCVVDVDDNGTLYTIEPLRNFRINYNVTIADPDAALAECLRIKAEREAKEQAVGEANLALSGFVDGFAGNQEHDPDNPTNYNAIGARSSLAMAFALQNANLTDSQAVFCASEFPEWHIEVDYLTNQIARFKGNLYRCKADHRSTADTMPDKDETNWYAIDMGTNTTEEWIQPTGTHDAYNVGDVVLHNDATWECTINNNQTEPVDDVSCWKKVE